MYRTRESVSAFTLFLHTINCLVDKKKSTVAIRKYPIPAKAAPPRWTASKTMVIVKPIGKHKAKGR